MLLPSRSDTVRPPAAAPGPALNAARPPAVYPLSHSTGKPSGLLPPRISPMASPKRFPEGVMKPITVCLLPDTNPGIALYKLTIPSTSAAGSVNGPTILKPAGAWFVMREVCGERQEMKKTGALIPSLLALAGLSTGCAGPVPPAGQHLLVAAIDRSASTNGMREDHLDVCDVARKAAILRGGNYELRAFASTDALLWGPGNPIDSSAIQSAKRRWLGCVDTAAVHVTRPALELEAIAADPAFWAAKSATIMLETDGDSDVASDSARFDTAMRAVAGRPGVRLIVFGIHAENRRRWEDALSRAGSHNYRLLAAQELASARQELFN